jgi:hypothetical protein
MNGLWRLLNFICSNKLLPLSMVAINQVDVPHCTSTPILGEYTAVPLFNWRQMLKRSIVCATKTYPKTLCLFMATNARWIRSTMGNYFPWTRTFLIVFFCQSSRVKVSIMCMPRLHVSGYVGVQILNVSLFVILIFSTWDCYAGSARS